MVGQYLDYRLDVTPHLHVNCGESFPRDCPRQYHGTKSRRTWNVDGMMFSNKQLDIFEI